MPLKSIMKGTVAAELAQLLENKVAIAFGVDLKESLL
jgi:hypothetical protein